MLVLKMSDPESNVFSSVDIDERGMFELKFFTLPSAAERVLPPNSSTVQQSREWYKVELTGFIPRFAGRNVEFSPTKASKTLDHDKQYKYYRSLRTAAGDNMEVWSPSSEAANGVKLYEKSSVTIAQHELDFLARSDGIEESVSRLKVKITPMMQLSQVSYLGDRIWTAKAPSEDGHNSAQLMSFRQQLTNGADDDPSVIPVTLNETGWTALISGAPVPLVLMGSHGSHPGFGRIDYRLEAVDPLNNTSSGLHMNSAHLVGGQSQTSVKNMIEETISTQGLLGPLNCALVEAACFDYDHDIQVYRTGDTVLEYCPILLPAGSAPILKGLPCQLRSAYPSSHCASLIW